MLGSLGAAAVLLSTALSAEESTLDPWKAYRTN